MPRSPGTVMLIHQHMELQEPRLGMFKELLTLSEQYKHVNQWK